LLPDPAADQDDRESWRAEIRQLEAMGVH